MSSGNRGALGGHVRAFGPRAPRIARPEEFRADKDGDGLTASGKRPGECLEFDTHIIGVREALAAPVRACMSVVSALGEPFAVDPPSLKVNRFGTALPNPLHTDLLQVFANSRQTTVLEGRSRAARAFRSAGRTI